MPGKHAEFGPSSLEATILCPGKRNYEQGFPAGPPSPAAIDGTKTHSLREYCLTASISAASLIGREIKDPTYGAFIVDKERAQRVDLGLEWLSRQADPMEVREMAVEKRVNPGGLIGFSDWWGTCDLIIRTDTWVMINDYKDGGFPVRAKDNHQLISYGLGYLDGHRWIPDDFQFRLVIDQPKVSPLPSQWVTTAGELRVKIPFYQMAINKALMPDAPRIPGDKQCKFCRGRLQCPERTQQAAEVAGELFMDVKIPTDVKQKGIEIISQTFVDEETSELVPATPFSLPVIDDNLGNDKLAQYIDAFDVIRGWMTEVEREGLKRAQAGQKITDHKVVRAKSNRKYIADEDKVKVTLKNMGLKKADYIEEKVKSFTKVLAVQKLTDRQRERIKKELLIKPEGALILAPESDERQEVMFNAEDIFKDVNVPGQVIETPTISFL